MTEITKPKPLFWSIEYTDQDGQKVIKHVIGTPSEIKTIIDKFIDLGVEPTAYQISPPAVT